MKLLESIKRRWQEFFAVQSNGSGCPHCGHSAFFVLNDATGLRKCASCEKLSFPPSGESLSILERGPNPPEPQERFVRRMTIRRPPATENQ